MKILWEEDAWEDYMWWHSQDKKTLKKIHQIIKEIQRDPFGCIGKTEPLRGNLAGFWSRRIDDKNRIIYTKMKENIIVITACKGHYDD